MPPTEQKILTNFLLPPAPLPTLITLQSFTSLFPRSQQSSSHIRTLYRDLQHQRAQLIDTITAEIEREVRRGKAMERAVVRGRRNDDRLVDDDEISIERALHNAPLTPLPNSHPHSLHSILPALNTGVEDIEDEIAKLDSEAEELMAQMRETVGGLSDLRYGKMENKGLRGQILEGLERLEGVDGREPGMKKGR